MSRFESSRFVRNPKVMRVDVLKSACDTLGWSYTIKGNELLVTDARQGARLYGEYALKLNLTSNEVTYNTYYMPNAEQKVEELQNQFYALNAAYAKNSLVQEFKKKDSPINQMIVLLRPQRKFIVSLWLDVQKTKTRMNQLPKSNLSS